MSFPTCTPVVMPKTALILQADWEGGMCKVARDLQRAGVDVRKVCFSFSDKLYHYNGIDCVEYKKPLIEFEQWLREYIREHHVDTLILYNQHRPYNEVGWKLAHELELECLVLELGLLRPDFTTIFTKETEPFSFFSKHWKQIKSAPLPDTPVESYERTARSDSTVKLTKMGLSVLASRIFMRLGSYKLFIDQRKLSLRHHLFALYHSLFRYAARSYQKEMKDHYWEEKADTYFLAPLQVHCDSQIILKSDFVTIEQFIDHVAESFLEHAPADKKLVFKVHPMDRGYRDYTAIIDKYNRACGEERFIYLDRIHLPSALSHAAGCITINSSVGLSALQHKTPTICLGKAVYDLPSLTSQDGLDSFWANPSPVKASAVEKFIHTLKVTNQAQGVLYQDIFNLPTESKIYWPPIYKDLFTPKVISHNVEKTYENTKLNTPLSTADSL